MAVAQVAWLQVASAAVAQVSWLEVAPPAPLPVAQVSWLEVLPAAVNHVMDVLPGVFTLAGAASYSDLEIDAAPGVFVYSGGAAEFTLVPYVPAVNANIPPRRANNLNRPPRRRAAT